MRNQELNIQTAIVRYLRLNGVVVFSIPNGTHIKSVVTRSLWKQSGLMAGVSDLIVLGKNKQIYFIEIKTPIGKQSNNQKEFQRIVENLGLQYFIWNDIKQAIDFYDNIYYK